MSYNHFGHMVGHAFRDSHKLSAVKGRKNPFFGFLAGFLFGPFGVGIYLGSFTDFLITMTLVVIGSISTVGIGAPVFWLMCGCWNFVRVNNSNKRFSPD